MCGLDLNQNLRGNVWDIDIKNITLSHTRHTKCMGDAIKIVFLHKKTHKSVISLLGFTAFWTEKLTNHSKCQKHDFNQGYLVVQFFGSAISGKPWGLA